MQLGLTSNLHVEQQAGRKRFSWTVNLIGWCTSGKRCFDYCSNQICCVFRTRTTDLQHWHVQHHGQLSAVSPLCIWSKKRKLWGYCVPLFLLFRWTCVFCLCIKSQACMIWFSLKMLICRCNLTKCTFAYCILKSRHHNRRLSCQHSNSTQVPRDISETKFRWSFQTFLQVLNVKQAVL